MPKLIIAEKPSVAKDIANAIGQPTKINGCWEVGDYVVTNCVGHLFSVCQPKDFNPDWKQWSFDTLPMIPERLIYNANPSTAAQWKVVKDALQRKDLTAVINGCDAGREGELIFWLAYTHARVSTPIKRLWISSMTKESILNGLAEIKDASVYQGLLESAQLRQFADWVIGLNATRAFTLAARHPGEVFSLGRVQTPTLALIVNRDNEIEKFVSVPYWQIKADFLPEGLSAWLCDEKFQAITFENKISADNSESQIKAIQEKPIILSIDKKEISIKQPLLFDLTALQRELNKTKGYSAAKTLEYTQSLYEKKLLTYPRTSSAYLSQTVAEKDIPNVLRSLKNCNISDFSKFAEKIKTNGWNKLSSRHVDDNKVTDHHAIIPTPETADYADLSKEEISVYETVVRRFLAAFYPAGKDERTSILIGLKDHRFIARGVIKKELGWREVLNFVEEIEVENGNDEDSNGSLPDVNQNSNLSLKSVNNFEKKTKPPVRFNEASLLKAMETAGRNLDDEDARQAMKDCGLGMPATRADIIEKLLTQQYIERKGKQLISTSKARQLIKALQSVNSILVSPELTGNWEKNLQMIANNEAIGEPFAESVKRLTRKITNDIRNSSLNYIPDHLDNCPKCETEGRKGFIKALKAASGNYLICTLGKDACGYISLNPPNATLKSKLLKERCSKCKSPMIFRISKEKQTPYLKCSKQNCEGILFFETKRSKQKNSSRKSQKAKKQAN